MILEYLLLLFLFFYLVQIAVLLVAVGRPRDVIDPAAEPMMSVIIAARNEEGHLAVCLESVLNQTYDHERFEVIVINDHSTDKTESICREYTQRFTNFRYANAREDLTLRGKANALDQGIQISRGDVILITDADCTVPPTWIEWTAKRYAPRVGIVGGLTLQESSSAFDGMQSLDWAFLLGLAAATISLRKPLSTIGNNLSFRKSAYLAIGGYRKIPFSVTEDFMLFQAIVGSKAWEYLCPVDPRVLVISQPCPSWTDLLRQKQRWGKGGLDMKLSGFSIMGLGFGFDFLFLLTLVMGSVWFAVGSIVIKATGDFLFLRRILAREQRKDMLRYFHWFELYFLVYVLVLPVVVFFGGPVRWKGRSY